MALIKCKECGSQISKSAQTCPHCGYKPRKTSLVAWLALFFVGIPVLIGIFSGFSAKTTSPTTPKIETMTPEQVAEKKKKDEAVQKAAAGAVTMKRAMRDPDSFKLESALVIDGTGAVCYGYRAKNGFGGMNAGNAVLSSDSKQFKTDDMDGFSKLWKKECEGKRGRDVATAIRWFAL